MVTSKVIQFQRPKDPLDFAGMGIKIDVEDQRESWETTFTSVQTALRFCNLDHAEAEAAARYFSEDGIIDEIGSDWAESIDYLEAIVETMKAACIRLEISEKRVIAAKNSRNT
jgi:hypothetical protein